MRTILIALLALASCQAPPPPPAPVADPDAPRKEVLALLESLERSFYVHWGSVESTAEYRTFRDEHLPILRQVADSNGEYALVAMRVLAKRAPGERFSPAARSILYWTLFARDALYNRWGLISKEGFLPGVYGAEVIALGAAAAPYFQQSLHDQRRALVFGPEDERAGRIRGDRVCDYAWVLLSTMFKRPVDYVEDPRLRDAQIHELDLWLDRRK